MDELIARLERLEYHQQLLLKMINPVNKDFDLMIIKKQLEEKEVKEFFQLCEELSCEMKKQKAENFVFYSPLYKQFTKGLNKKMDPEETVKSCLRQGVYPGLMEVLWLNIK